MGWRTENYNLLEEEWIPVVECDGGYRRVGIKTAFIEAHRIRGIASTNPMDRIAILRFLLALLYWFRGKTENGEGFASGRPFPSGWFSKLDAGYDCFNLLGKGKRFYQYRKPGDSLTTANYLIHEVPTGTNINHFKHSMDGRDGLCPACCAMGLVRLPVFATSGGRGKPPGINAKPPVYAIPVGETLAETLRFSWRKIPDSDLGIPSWENPDSELPSGGRISLLTGLTWLPRRVWLEEPEGEEASCIYCGRWAPLVKKCVFAGIGSTKSKGYFWHDPHVVYDNSGKAIGPKNTLIKDTYTPACFFVDSLQNISRDVGRFLPPHKDNAPERGYVCMVGFSTVQNDKYLEAVEDSIPFPSSSSGGQEIKEYIEKIKELKGDKLVNKLRRIISRKRSKRSEVSKVSKMVGKLIAGIAEPCERTTKEYRPFMKAVASAISPGFTTGAVKRRKRIASLKPDIRSFKTAQGASTGEGR